MEDFDVAFINKGDSLPRTIPEFSKYKVIDECQIYFQQPILGVVVNKPNFIIYINSFYERYEFQCKLDISQDNCSDIVDEKIKEIIKSPKANELIR